MEGRREGGGKNGTIPVCVGGEIGMESKPIASPFEIGRVNIEMEIVWRARESACKRGEELVKIEAGEDRGWCRRNVAPGDPSEIVMVIRVKWIGY